MKRYTILAALLVLVLSVGVVAAQGISPTKIRQLMVDIDAIIGRNLSVGGNVVITVPTTQATATPGFRVNNTSAGAVSAQIEVNATPVAQFLRGGGLTLNTGNLSLTSGNVSLTSGNLGLTSGNVAVVVPTAQTTATPGARLNNTSAGAVTFQMELSGTSVAKFLHDGGLTLETGNLTLSGGNLLVTGDGVVTVPTAQTTATPGVRINNTSAGVVGLQVELNATPVAQFLRNGGLTINTGSLTLGSDAFTGPVKYGAYTITQDGLYTITHGMSTTPTMSIVMAAADGYTATVTSMNATQILGAGNAIVGQTIYWIAGK